MSVRHAVSSRTVPPSCFVFVIRFLRLMQPSFARRRLGRQAYLEQLMNLSLKALGIGLFLALLTAPASAVVMDSWTPAEEILLDLDLSAGVAAYAFQHDITDDGFTIGDIVDSATLIVTVRDSGGSEAYRYEIGIGPTQVNAFLNASNPANTDEISLLAPSLADLQSDGIIDVVMRLTGDLSTQEGLYFIGSLLVADLHRNSAQPNPLPEPTTLALLGVVLANLGYRLRKRSTN